MRRHHRRRGLSPARRGHAAKSEGAARRNAVAEAGSACRNTGPAAPRPPPAPVGGEGGREWRGRGRRRLQGGRERVEGKGAALVARREGAS